MLKKIVVTGGSGKAGRAVVRDLLERGYEVLNVDLIPSRETLPPYLKVDLTDLGQTFEALAGADAVVHLAAIPAPGLQPAEVTFRINMASTYNIFSTFYRQSSSVARLHSSILLAGSPVTEPARYLEQCQRPGERIMNYGVSFFR